MVGSSKNPSPRLVPLPVDERVAEALTALKTGHLVVVAEPGAGKTTRLPFAMVQPQNHGRVVVLEPRRLAARLSAVRVAEERGLRLGDEVGYQVRFENVTSERTRLVYLTEGLLTQKIKHDRALKDVSVLVLDEFHERSLHTDLAIATAKQISLSARPDLRIVVMSATMDGERVVDFLGRAHTTLLNVPGRTYPVSIGYDPPSSDLRTGPQKGLPSWEEHTHRVIRREGKLLLEASSNRDCLVFLPGKREIQRAQRALVNLNGIEVRSLHGDLSPDEQDKVLAKSDKPRVILTTNVAETSITVDGVGLVIDPGFARLEKASNISGIGRLEVGRVSQAAATQRAGRAGRTAPGRALRLYSEIDFRGRGLHEAPQIARGDLLEFALTLAYLRAQDQSLAFYEAPHPQRWSETLRSLEILQLTKNGEISLLGRLIAEMPIHPRAALAAVTLKRLDYEEDAALLGAWITDPPDVNGNGDVARSDVLWAMDRYLSGDLNSNVRTVERVRNQVARVLSRVQLREDVISLPELDADRETAILYAIFRGFTDLSAKALPKGNRANQKGDVTLYTLRAGTSIALGNRTMVHDEPWAVVLEGESRDGVLKAENVSGIEPAWLLHLFENELVSTSSLTLEKSGPVRTERLSWEALTLIEERQKVSGPEAKKALALDAIKAAGLTSVFDGEALTQFRARLMWAHRFDEKVPLFESLDLEGIVSDALDAGFDFANKDKPESKQTLWSVVHLRLNNVSEALRDFAPQTVKLPGREQAEVHYSLDGAPYVASRFQEFFGLAEGPKLGRGKDAQPLVLHLLAPNYRAEQVTTDLSGFWKNHYPELRRSLMRRYPRHFWPEDPLTAEAKQFVKKR